MGNWSESLVGNKVLAIDAPELEKNILRYLVEQKIIEKKKTPCLLGDELGYKPGKNYMSITELGKEDVCSNCNYKEFISFSVNGLEVCTNHCMGLVGQGEWKYTICPMCNKRSLQDKNWGIAMEEWMNNEKGLHTCQNCKKLSPINEWDNCGDIALGHLVLTFWNWPQLSKEFLEKLAIISGHKFIVISGKL